MDQKTHVNTAEALVYQLRKRPGLVYLRRLSIILDGDSEKGFGLVRGYSYATYSHLDNRLRPMPMLHCLLHMT